MATSEAWIEECALKRVELIFTEGKKHKGVSASVKPDQPPAWYDADKFRRAQDLWSDFKVV